MDKIVVLTFPSDRSGEYVTQSIASERSFYTDYECTSVQTCCCPSKSGYSTLFVTLTFKLLNNSSIS